MRYHQGLGIGHLGIGLAAAPHSLTSSPLDQSNAQGIGAECNEEAEENFWERSANINLGSDNWDIRSNKYLSDASEWEDDDGDGMEEEEEEGGEEEDLGDGHAAEEDSDVEGDSEYGD